MYVNRQFGFRRAEVLRLEQGRDLLQGPDQVHTAANPSVIDSSIRGSEEFGTLPVSSVSVNTVATQPGPWSATFRTTTMGIFALAFLVAFESLAVTTVMPVVAADLDGLRVYGLAFAMPMAVSVFALTLAGPWMDHRGPGPATRVGVAVFAAGLLAAGLAPTMTVFLVGRAIQGFGTGLIDVGLYVMIARLYPPELRPRVFTVLTSAWVMPALIGPAIAGTVAHIVGWRWVFLGVPLLAIVAAAMIWNAVGSITSEGGRTHDARRPRWALAAAIGVLVVSVAGQRNFAGWPLVLSASVVAVIIFASRLLPPGTWRLRPGLPGVIALRGLTSTAFFAAEVYVPLSLVHHHGFTPAIAGIVLTCGAVAWFAGSWIAANVAYFEDKSRRARLGILLVAVGVGLSAATLATVIPVAVAILGWALAGMGMGMAMSTLSVLLLDSSRAGDEGVNSSALQINDAITQSLALALGSAAFASLLGSERMLGYLVNFAGAFALGLAATLAAPRLLKPC